MEVDKYYLAQMLRDDWYRASEKVIADNNAKFRREHADEDYNGECGYLETGGG